MQCHKLLAISFSMLAIMLLAAPLQHCVNCISELNLVKHMKFQDPRGDTEYDNN